MEYAKTPILFNTNKKYRHQLDEEFELDLCQKFSNGSHFNGFVTLTEEGILTLSKGYAWDGVSFPKLDIDSCKNLRASVVHDALYQLIRNDDEFRTKENKKIADKILRELLILDGFSKIAAWSLWIAVSAFGKPGTEPGGRFPNGQSPCAK